MIIKQAIVIELQKKSLKHTLHAHRIIIKSTRGVSIIVRA